MKRILLASAALLALTAAQPTLAADAPVYKGPPPAAAMYNWSGFYVGISGGGIWGKTQWSDGAITVPGNNSDWLLGGTLGYSWQSGPWVFGIEGDYSWTGLRILIAPCGGPCTTDLNTLGTVRGRIGWATGSTGALLLFLTGGLAFGEVENNLGAVVNNKTTVSGWTVGGGAEMALVGNLTAKIEYLYVDLGGTVACPASACGTQNNNDFVRASVVRGGLNWRF